MHIVKFMRGIFGVSALKIVFEDLTTPASCCRIPTFSFTEIHLHAPKILAVAEHIAGGGIEIMKVKKSHVNVRLENVWEWK